MLLLDTGHHAVYFVAIFKWVEVCLSKVLVYGQSSLPLNICFVLINLIDVIFSIKYSFFLLHPFWGWLLPIRVLNTTCRQVLPDLFSFWLEVAIHLCLCCKTSIMVHHRFKFPLISTPVSMMVCFVSFKVYKTSFLYDSTPVSMMVCFVCYLVYQASFLYDSTPVNMMVCFVSFMVY